MGFIILDYFSILSIIWTQRGRQTGRRPYHSTTPANLHHFQIYPVGERKGRGKVWDEQNEGLF